MDMDMKSEFQEGTLAGTWIQLPIVVAGRSFRSLDELTSAFEKVLQVNENLSKQLEHISRHPYDSWCLSPKVVHPGRLERKWSAPSDVLKEGKRRVQQEFAFNSAELPRKDLQINIKTGNSKQHNKPETPKKAPPAIHPEIEALQNPKDEIDASIWKKGQVPEFVSQLLDKGEKEGWIFKGEDIQLGRRLGRGASGATYKAQINNRDVAVKCVKIRKADEVISFLREVDALSSVKHPYILPFMGVVFNPPRQCWIVMEYMRGGTLNHWLYGRKNGQKRRRCLTDRVMKALEVARGMQRLEDNKPYPFLHRDIKPGNIFIDPSGHARVGDFGLARRLTREAIATLTGETGTYIYMAPEVLRHEIYDNKADVYSWGVTFAELINQRPPYSELNLTPIQIGIAVADEELQPTIQCPSCPSVFHTLLQMCCDFDPIMRPSFRQIVQHLDALMPEISGRVDMPMPITDVRGSSLSSGEFRNGFRSFQHAGSHHSASTYAPADEQENL